KDVLEDCSSTSSYGNQVLQGWCQSLNPLVTVTNTAAVLNGSGGKIHSLARNVRGPVAIAGGLPDTNVRGPALYALGGSAGPYSADTTVRMVGGADACSAGKCTPLPVFTPLGSGLVKITAVAQGSSTVAAVALTFQIRYGTTASPATLDAATGTLVGTTRSGASGLGNHEILTACGIAQLTPLTAYWIDVAFATANAADPVSISAIDILIEELDA